MFTSVGEQVDVVESLDGEPRTFRWRGWQYEVIGLPQRMDAGERARVRRWRVSATCDDASFVTADLVRALPEPDCLGGGGPMEPALWVLQAVDEWALSRSAVRVPRPAAEPAH